MDSADPVWLVSPHLLVAQAVAVALASVGIPAEAHTWASSVLGQPLGTESQRPRRLVVILDRFEGRDRIAEVARLVQTDEARIVLVASFEVATWWGELLQDDRVDLATDVTSIARLKEVVDDFMAGRTLMDPEQREAVRVAWLAELERRRHVEELLRSLSPQQSRVLELLASGRRVAEVGALLGVTRGTVRSHVKALRAKLGARSQLEAVAMLRVAHDAGSTGSAELVPRPRRVSDGSEAGTRR